MLKYANFNVDQRRQNKMAARGWHIQKFVILAATLCCDKLTISWRDKLTLNSFMMYPFQVGKYNHHRSYCIKWDKFNFQEYQCLDNVILFCLKLPPCHKKALTIKVADYALALSTKPEAQVINVCLSGHIILDPFKCQLTLNHNQTMLRFSQNISSRNLLHLVNLINKKHSIAHTHTQR